MSMLIIRFVAWVLAKKITPVSNDLWWLVEEAEMLVRDIDSIKDVTAEYKRHKVYSLMVKAHPSVKPRDISYAIEVAVQRVL